MPYVYSYLAIGLFLLSLKPLLKKVIGLLICKKKKETIVVVGVINIIIMIIERY